jgi:tRNA (adenine22-N1)-methyltransferase
LKVLRYKQLDARLSAIAELVREGADVCDIGTDHAYLPCFLARQKKSGECNFGQRRFGKIYAADLNTGPLEFARATLTKQGLTEGADVVLLQSNGLEKVPPCDDIIIAGMGGELISEILGAMPADFRERDLRLILQPMSKAQHLRDCLEKSGIEIISEKSVREGRRDFIVIHAKLRGGAES